MYRYLVLGPGLAIETWAVVAAAATVLAMLAVRSEARRLGHAVGPWIAVVAGAGTAALLGGHVLHSLTRLDLPLAHRLWLLVHFENGGYSWYGGFLAATIVVTASARLMRVPLLRAYDISAFAVLVVQPILRLGCFANGCCYGKATDAWWGVLDLERVPRHPTQLLEAGYLVAVFAALWARRRGTANGVTVARYLVLAPLGRFALDFLRRDSIRPELLGGLTLEQAAVLPLLAMGLVLGRKLKTKGTRAVP